MSEKTQAEDKPFLFADEKGTEKAVSNEQPPEWKVIISDDEEEVHHVTRMVLSDFSFKGRGIELISAYSGEETMQIVRDNPDAAILLLDVVMEEDDSGFKVVKYIRDVLKNDIIQIVLRTGQASQEPEKYIVERFEINDYKTKTELTSYRLFATLMSLLRAYQLASSYQKINRKLQKTNIQLEGANDELERKNAELLYSQQRLRISEERYAALINSLPSGVLQIDLEGNIIFLNIRAASILGFENKNFSIGQSFLEFIPEENRKKWEIEKNIILEKGSSYGFEYRIKNFNNEILHIETTALKLKDENEVTTILYTIQDISERKKHEEIIERYQHQLEILLDEIPVSVVILDEHNDLVYMNKTFLNSFSYEYEDIWSSELWHQKAFPDEKYRREIQQRWEDVSEKIKKEADQSYGPIEMSVTAKNGSLIVCDVRMVKINKNLIVSYVDVTDRKVKQDEISLSLLEKENLLNEIHYRTRENLQIILSLLVLQSINASDDMSREVLKKAERRISTVSSIHEFISIEGSRKKLVFQDFVEKLIKETSRALGINSSRFEINIKGSGSLLSTDEAFLLSIILYELVSNSALYAYAGDEQVWIFCSLERGSEGKSRLCFKDRGKGFSLEQESTATSGMGLTLVKSILKQVKGDFNLSTGGGTEFDITYSFPETPFRASIEKLKKKTI